MDKKQKQKNKSKCLAKSGSKATLQFLDEERPQKEGKFLILIIDKARQNYRLQHKFMLGMVAK